MCTCEFDRVRDFFTGRRQRMPGGWVILMNSFGLYEYLSVPGLYTASASAQTLTQATTHPKVSHRLPELFFQYSVNLLIVPRLLFFRQVSSFFVEKLPRHTAAQGTVAVSKSCTKIKGFTKPAFPHTPTPFLPTCTLNHEHSRQIAVHPIGLLLLR